MFTLFLCTLLTQPPGKTAPAKSEPPPAKPSISRLLPQLKDLKQEQQAELKKLNDEYAAMIAELEAERDSKLSAVLTKDQRETLARLLADEIDRYRVVLRVRMPRPQALFKPMKDVLGLDPQAAKLRVDKTPDQPLAEHLPRAKAEALVKALSAAGAKATLERE
jgi:ribosomal protein L7/L12